MSVSPCKIEGGNQFRFESSIRSHHYLIHMLKMAKCPLLISLMVLLVLVGVSLLTVSVHGAPASSDGAHLSIIRSVEEGDSEKDLTTFMSLPSPPPAPKEERDVSHNTPFKINLPFIKNSQCKLHRADGTTKPKMCGLRELELPGGASGIKSWNPGLCRPFHCKCVATKEVQRIKRTIADNQTTLNYRKFRVFECV